MLALVLLSVYVPTHDRPRDEQVWIPDDPEYGFRDRERKQPVHTPPTRMVNPDDVCDIFPRGRTVPPRWIPGTRDTPGRFVAMDPPRRIATTVVVLRNGTHIETYGTVEDVYERLGGKRASDRNPDGTFKSKA